MNIFDKNNNKNDTKINYCIDNVNVNIVDDSKTNELRTQLVVTSDWHD